MVFELPNLHPALALPGSHCTQAYQSLWAWVTSWLQYLGSTVTVWVLQLTDPDSASGLCSAALSDSHWQCQLHASCSAPSAGGLSAAVWSQWLAVTETWVIVKQEDIIWLLFDSFETQFYSFCDLVIIWAIWIWITQLWLAIIWKTNFWIFGLFLQWFQLWGNQLFDDL